MRPATQNIGYFYAICYFADRFSFAHFLLDELCGVALDESEGRKALAGTEISKAFDVNERTVCQIARRFVEEGLESALERKKQLNRHHKITGDVEAQMIAIACSDAPEGYSRWTLQMIADKLVELKVIDSISATAVGTTLKKANSNHG